MKKFILAFATVAFIGLGGTAPASAQGESAPVDCIDKPSSDPSDPCFNPVIYPPTTPATSVAPPTVPVTSSLSPTVPSTSPATTSTTVAALTPVLPQTGSSGISPILGTGALLLIAGGLIVVAARRRSTTASPTA